ncbi:MAG: hypothetical protein H6625_05640 [Bdellovibrionaceae bacterium]|nr:hypothetical protein [Pseudobdellovibrionaceae bacterium]
MKKEQCKVSMLVILKLREVNNEENCISQKDLIENFGQEHHKCAGKADI